MADKRGLVIILVITTVVIFIGLVWAISTYLPLNLAPAPSPTLIVDAPRKEVNCASSIVYWAQHPELYPDQVVIAGQVYNAGDLNKIFSVQADDLPAKLQAQLTAAYLNILSGADQSYIETTIFEAYAWLVKHPAGSEVTDSERVEGTRLLNLLEAYNLGLTGVRACGNTLFPSTQEIIVVDTATATNTVTASPTSTPMASETQTLIEVTATATYEYIPPTRAPTKTTAPPIQYPTNTSVPPTQAPAPTNTPRPPDTPTFTPPPTPTPKPTLPPPTPTIPGPSSILNY